ncbi:MAG: 30S ribosome-binding factor RbfA [Lachnospiraceae bacterium]|jgi:ribosome-binding factor A
MKKHSVKSIRINGEVQKELSAIIRESKDPRIHPMTSVVMADVATDLRTCKAYISVLGDDKDRSRTEEGLKSAAGFIRKELARRLNLRNTPELTFIMDTSIEDAIRMTRLIDEVIKNENS